MKDTIGSLVPLIFTTLTILIISTFVYLYKPYWDVRRVPGPPHIPLIGHLHLMAKYGPDVFNVLAKQHGPIFRFHMGRQPLVIIGDAELCREVGIRKFKYIPNRSIPSPISASPLHQRGLFFTRDARWATMRNTIISMYQPSHLGSLIPSMQSSIERASRNVELSEKQKDDLVFSNLSLRLATDVIGEAAFGMNFGLLSSDHAKVDGTGTGTGKDHDQVVTDFINQHIYSTTTLKMDLSGSLAIIVGLFIPLLQEPVRQILRWFPGTMDWKVERTNQKLATRMNGIVAKRMQDKDRITSSKDFLSLILNARESETVSGKVFTEDYISALTYEHLLAGSVTTSFTLSSVVYLVSCHPLVENKLIQEIDAYQHDQVPTAQDLQYKFPYLDQVIKESMRFYTVSPLIAREAATPVEVGGYQLKKGTWIWLAPGVLAKDPKNFPNPDKFIPERFDPDCEEEKKRHPYAHIPFGLGPRACIGQKFSLQEIKLTLVHLYRNYVFRHSPDMEKPLEFVYGIVLNYRHGVKLKAIKRHGILCKARNS